MTKPTFHNSLNYFALLILIAVFVVSLSIWYLSLLPAHPELAAAVTFDLILFAPLLYLFLIRSTKIPKTTAIPFFVFTVILATYLLPADQQFYLDLIKTWIIPVVEICVLGFIVVTVYKTLKIYRSEKNKDADVLNVLGEISEQLVRIPALNKLFAFELAVFYYAFISWKRTRPKGQIFTYHRNSGKILFFAIIIFIIIAETAVVHYLLSLWNFYVAWLVTLISLYVALQLFAHLKAVYLRPVEIIGNKLFVRYGLFAGSVIDLQNIEKAEITTIKPTDTMNLKHVSLLADMEQFNLKISLAEKTEFYGFYGKRETFRTLLLYLDEPQEFINSINPNTFQQTHNGKNHETFTDRRRKQGFYGHL